MKSRDTALAVLVVALSVSAGATTMVKLSVEDLTRASTLVVRAKVAKVQSRWGRDHRHIVTDIDLDVLETLKGTAQPQVHLLEPGGVVDDIGQKISGTPSFSVGEEAVVFLEPLGDAGFAVVGMSQGKLSVQRSSDGAQAFVVPEKVDALLLDPQTHAEAPANTRAMPLEDFKAAVRPGAVK